MYSRICSSARNAEWPSFMWKTVGFSPIAFSARMPPMPSTISCRMRVSMIAAVERVGDVAILRQFVLGNVGVEQVERDAADVEYSRPGCKLFRSAA